MLSNSLVENTILSSRNEINLMAGLSPPACPMAKSAMPQSPKTMCFSYYITGENYMQITKLLNFRPSAAAT